MCVCGSIISRTGLCLKYNFGRCLAQNPRTCCVECEAVWMGEGERGEGEDERLTEDAVFTERTGVLQQQPGIHTDRKSVV